MNANNFPLEKLSIGQLYNSGDITYEIPIYQRNYAWEEDQIRTLIQDIYDAFKATPQKESYYIGTLVTFDKGDKVYEVIDGQQRLTTIYLLLKVLQTPIKNKLTYRSRKKSKDTLENLPSFDETENVDTDIQNGYYYAASAIPDIIDASETERFSNYLQHNVHILHYTVPKDVDLNHYFEVMNSRGEQLEKHEIVKAYLCETLDQEEMKKFNHIWENCSRMDVYIQQLLDNDKIFGPKLNECPDKSFDDLPNCHENGKAKNTIRNFMHGNIGNLTEETECDKNDTFQPIVDFPNFLLIVLKITRILDKNDKFDPTDFILDDKELINEFDKVERKNKDFVKNFAFNLLKTKFLLDNYIIHHTYEEDKIGVNPWQLRKFVLEDNKRSTKNLSDNTEIQDRLVQLLSMFEVSFSARQRKNYLFYSLLYLFNNTDLKQYADFLQKLADKYFFDVYLDPENLNDSNNRPKPNSFDKTILKDGTIDLNIHNNKPDFNRIYGDGQSPSKGIQLYIFNYADYKLWHKYASGLRGKSYNPENRERIEFFNSLGCSDFGLDTFDSFYFSRTRKSLEHFYPTAKLGTGNELTQANINCFGNYAMIGAEANSSGSNLAPKAKIDRYTDKKYDQISIASLKFRIMMQICKDNRKKQLIGEIHRPNEMEWNYEDMARHQEKMLAILIPRE